MTRSPFVQAQHRVVRRIQPEQTPEPRLKPKPLRCKNAKKCARARPIAHPWPASISGTTCSMALRARAAASQSAFRRHRVRCTHVPSGRRSSQSAFMDSGSEVGPSLHTFQSKTAHIADCLTSTPLRTPVIPLGDGIKRTNTRKPGQPRRLLSSLQRAGEYTIIIETLREGHPKPFSGRYCLLLTYCGQGEYSYARMLAGFAPHGCP